MAPQTARVKCHRPGSCPQFCHRTKSSTLDQVSPGLRFLLGRAKRQNQGISKPLPTQSSGSTQRNTDTQPWGTLWAGWGQ